jgi:hypothetical protein
LAALEALGDRMLNHLYLESSLEQGSLDKSVKALYEDLKGTFERDYQNWYTEASALVKQLVPDRLEEFEELYRGRERKKDFPGGNYNIQDWLTGFRSGKVLSGEKHFNDLAAVTMRFSTQLQIVKAAGRRFESRLFEIKQLVQADVFDSELSAARELATQGFLRAAGALAGVVLEKHLRQVTLNHSAKTRSKHPTIADLNDTLKDASVIDVPLWRQIQRLGDVRNLCGHSRQREPTAGEVGELLDGVEKITKTLF